MESHRYILPDEFAALLSASVPFEPKKELIFCLRAITKHHPPQQSTSGHSGFWFGPVGIAYLFFAISELFEDFEINGKSPDQWCAEYLSAAKPTRNDVAPDHCGLCSPILSYCAVAAALTKDMKYVHEFVSYLPNITTKENDASSEWLYGKAGALALARIIRDNVPGSEEALKSFGEAVVKAIFEEGPPWKWHGKQYLGAVHGEIGIVTQLVLWDAANAQKLEACLEKLLQMQNELGNWPSSRNSERSGLVQFCHGAPGFVISLMAIRMAFPTLKDKIDGAIGKGRECIIEYGLLRKVPSLCHGVAGNALALSSEQRGIFLKLCTKDNIQKGIDERWFNEDASFGEHYSLGSGMAGVAWLWTGIASGTARTVLVMPGYS